MSQENNDTPEHLRDVFLSYSRADTEAVVAIRAVLQARGLSTFFDREQLLAGMPWPHALEQGLRGARSVAVFMGPSGLGLWQKREMAFALDRQVAEERQQSRFPVIPVLLPGADVTPGFLFLNTWVDLRTDPTDPEGVDTLFRVIRGEAEEERQDSSAGLCPYQGLRPFREESAAFFCGREAFSRRIKDTLLQRGLVVIIGPSGSGKSSIVQAGVLPLLRRERPPAATWDAACFIPGERPFQRLAAALMPLLEPELAETESLARAEQLARMLAEGKTLLRDVADRILVKSGGTDRLLVVIDQFEELFTLCPEEERRRFLDMLLQTTDRSRLTAIITLRGSFYERLIGADRRISDRLENAIVNLGPMTREELHAAIVDPAKRLGHAFEPGLAKRMLDDVGEEPGNLPLMEFALTELWARRDGRKLTHAAYEQIGGVAGAIVQRAESVFRGLAAVQQEAAKRLLMRLVWVGATADNVQEARQRIPLAELDTAAQDVAQTMADARLLVVGEEGAGGQLTVEVAHEALIRKWARLREWLDEDREFLLWRRRLQAAREACREDQEDEAALLRGTPLREAERWLHLRQDALGSADSAFIRASLAVEERERRALQRRRRRGQAVSTTLAVMFMCLAGLAGWQSLVAVSQELAASARSRLPIDPEQSLLLGIEAVKAQHTDEAYDVLKLALQNPLLAVLREDLDFLTQIRFSPNGKLLVTTGKDRKPHIWDWDGSKLSNPRSPPKLPDPINILAANPKWTLIAAANPDYSISLYEVGTGRALGRLEGHQAVVASAAFSPDGERLLSASDDGTARVWEVQSLRCLWVLRGHQDRMTNAAFSPDGQRAATASLDGTAIVWDTLGGKELLQLQGHRSAVNSIRFSADGNWLATASSDNSAGIWDAHTGKLLARLNGHVDTVTFAGFSPIDNGLLVTTSRDRSAKVWKSLSDGLDEWLPVEQLRGHSDVISAAAFSPDGALIATASRDRSIRLWKALSEHGRLALYGHRGAVHDAKFSPDGHHMASASSDNTVRLWKIGQPHSTHILAGHKDSLNSVSFNRDGSLVATGSDDHTAKIWDAASGRLLHTLGHGDSVNEVSFDSQGARLATASDDNTARVWDVASGKLLAVLDGGTAEAARLAPADGEEAAFSPDGTLVAVLDNGHAVAYVREIGTKKILAELKAESAGFTALAFSPRGDRLVAADGKGWIRLWDTQSWRSLAEFQGHQGAVADIAFRGDGVLFATAGEDRALRLWESTDGTPKGQPLIHSAALAKVEFSTDGKILIGSTVRHEISSWEAGTGKLKGTVCADCVPPGGHGKRVNSAEFSPDGKHILTASRDGTARVWDAASGRVAGVIEHGGPLVEAHFSPDGKAVMTISRDRKARIWRYGEEGFAPLSVLEGHGDELTAGKFSPDGRYVATASRDGTARVWETDTGTLAHVLKFHHDWINSVDFSPDGSRLVTASLDGTAAVWSLPGGDLKLELRGHALAVRNAHFSEDGSQVVTASRDGTLRLWNLRDIEENKICPECSGSIEEICKQARNRAGRELSADEREKYHLHWLGRLLDSRCPG